MIAINLNTDKTRDELTVLLQQAKRPRAMLAAVGRQGQQELKKHFRKKDRTEPNSLSPRRQHYWNGVSDATQAPVVVLGDTAVVISINHPSFAQKVFGGVIRAKNAQALTIPVSEEAYGRTAETFEAETGLKLVFVQGSRFGLLVTKRDPKSKFFQVEYILRASVYQRPDPTALPDTRDGSPFVKLLLERANAVLARQLQSPANPNN